MATLLQSIKEILRPGLLLDGPIQLEELAPGSTCEAIRLNKTGSPVVLKLDQPYRACARPGCELGLSANDRLFPLFNIGEAGICAVCDYVIFCQERADAPLYVLLCELKSGNPGGSHRQLKNARLLADYILAMATHHRPIHSPPQIERRGIVFSPGGATPKGSLHRIRCSYPPSTDGGQDMKFVHYRCGMEYPLVHFCA